MSFHVPETWRWRTHPTLPSSPLDGNNGYFIVRLAEFPGIEFGCLASDGGGWEHVSVTLNRNRCPTWDEMCAVKAMFWDPEDTVIQYHPAKLAYRDVHPYCLHVWRPIGVRLPVPPPIFVA